MMLGERTHGGTGLHVPPWSFAADNPIYFSLSPNKATTNASADDCSFFFHSNSFSASQCYSSSNTNDAVGQFQSPDSDNNGCGDFLSVDAHSCDNFRMFEFKVRMCPRGRSHDWTDCPFAHPGEKARRRDPRKFQYSGTACPEFRRGNCHQGDACEFAHGVFECWLHPARYRTLPCKDSMNCKRRVCFFAHSGDQLRVLSPVAESHDGLHHRIAFKSSPEFKSLPTESPPIPPMSANSVKEMVACLRQLQLNKVKSNMPSSWTGSRAKMTLPGYLSLPTTPTTRKVSRLGIGYFDTQFWEEPVMERVESGRDLRARMLQKLSQENPLDWVDPVPNPNPDADWVSELIK